MNSISSENIILKPVITEKTLLEQAKGKYVFWVDTKSTKGQITKAFKAVFGINPLSVNTNKLKGKLKTNWKSRKPIQKSDRKKAVVTIAKDQKIELLSLNTK